MNAETKRDLAIIFKGKRLNEDKAKILDVGSFNYNGGIRDLLPDCDITGIDVQPGLDVDIVGNCNVLPFPDNEFDAVLLLNEVEHDPKFWLTVEECKRVLKPGGAFIGCFPSIGFAYHPRPNDWYRFTHEYAMKIFLDGCDERQYSYIEGAPGIIIAWGHKEKPQE